MTWQTVAVVFLGAGVGVAAGFVPRVEVAMGLIGLAGTIVGGILGATIPRTKKPPEA